MEPLQYSPFLVGLLRSGTVAHALAKDCLLLETPIGLSKLFPRRVRNALVIVIIDGKIAESEQAALPETALLPHVLFSRQVHLMQAEGNVHVVLVQPVSLIDGVRD